MDKWAERVCSAVRNSSVKAFPSANSRKTHAASYLRFPAVICTYMFHNPAAPNPILNLFRAQPYTATQTCLISAPELHSIQCSGTVLSSKYGADTLPGAQIHTSHSVPGPPDTASNPGWQIVVLKINVRLLLCQFT